MICLTHGLKGCTVPSPLPLGFRPLPRRIQVEKVTLILVLSHFLLDETSWEFQLCGHLLPQKAGQCSTLCQKAKVGGQVPDEDIPKFGFSRTYSEDSARGQSRGHKSYPPSPMLIALQSFYFWSETERLRSNNLCLSEYCDDPRSSRACCDVLV